MSRLPLRDLERLSAYLDGELTPKEAAEVEARLESEPILRQELQALKRTVETLAAAPQLRPPRAFSLTAEMVGMRRRRSGYPILQLSTALATLAFFVIVGADVLSSTALGGAPALQPEAMFREAAAPEKAPALAVEQPVGEAESQAEAVSALPTGTPMPRGTQPPAELEAIAADEEQAKENAEWAAEADRLALEPEEVPAEDEVLQEAEEEGVGLIAGEEGGSLATPAPTAEMAEPEAGEELAEEVEEELPPIEPAAGYFAERETVEALARGEGFPSRAIFRWAEIILGGLVIVLAALNLRVRRAR